MTFCNASMGGGKASKRVIRVVFDPIRPCPFPSNNDRNSDLQADRPRLMAARV